MPENKKHIVGIHQPNLFPWLGYFEKIRRSDEFIILDNVDIVLGSAKAITHRTSVKSQSGLTWLTLPLVKSESKKINEIDINSKIDWRKDFLNKLTNYYRKAAFFEETFTLIQEWINIDEVNLAKFNTAIIKRVANYLDINTPIRIASELTDEYEDKNQRLVALVNAVNGNCYLSGKGGKKYNDEELFKKNGISIDYLKYQPCPYPQLYGEFLSGLGVIDFLMNEKEYNR